MKKILTFVVALILGFAVTVNAQVAPARFFDNTTLSLEGGVTWPMTNWDNISYGQVGVQLEKGLTPWVSVAAEGLFYMGVDGYNTKTAFDRVDVNGLFKFNVLNLFGRYPGNRRVFELVPFTGLGWGHLTAGYDVGDEHYHSNWMLYKAGVDFEFNLGKSRAWSLRLSPAVIWDNVGGMRLDKNNANFQVNVGVAYHFKNKDGNRYFTKVRAYDQAEVDGLNARIYDLMAENDELTHLNEALRNRPVETVTVVEKEVLTNTMLMLPKTQFYVNSANLLPEVQANIIEMANFMKANPETRYEIVGYASEDGPAAYNQTLSENRAKSLYDALIEQGVNADQLSYRGAGATDKFSTDVRTLNRVVVVEQK